MPIDQPEPQGKVRTKIVATVGPASREPARLADLIGAGVDVFRLNFSHGSRDEHSDTLAAIRRVADEAGRPVAVLQDLGGPKIRLGPIPGDAVECRPGDDFALVDDRTTDDDPRQLTSTYPGLAGDLKVGDVVLFADGTIAMGVAGVEPGRARLVVTLGGTLRSRQGINLPHADLKLDVLTPKDLADLDWTARARRSTTSASRSSAGPPTWPEAPRRARPRGASRAKDRRQDREAAGGGRPRRDRRRQRRRDGRPGRPGGRDGRGQASPRSRSGSSPSCHRARRPGDHGHADAQQHGRPPAAPPAPRRPTSSTPCSTAPTP